MNKFIVETAITFALMFVQSMMDGGLVKQVQELVIEAFDFEGTGEEKRQKVWAELRDIGGVIGKALAASAPWMINALIELTVGQYKTENEVK